MAVRTKTMLKNRRVKIKTFLEENKIIIPIIDYPVFETEDGNLNQNKMFQSYLKKKILPVIKKEITKDIKSDDFFKKPYCEGFKKSLSFNIRSKKDTEQFKLDLINAISILFDNSDHFLQKYRVQYLSPILVNTMDVAKDIVFSSMMIDTMVDQESSWLDFETSISLTAREECEEEGLPIKVQDYDVLLELSNDYVDYTTSILTMFIFKLFRRLDENSKEQLIGNLGSMYEIREVAEYVFISRLLSRQGNLKWMLAYVLESSQTLDKAIEGFSSYFLNRE